MSSQLKPFSYVVLALVGKEGASAHEIVEMMGRSPLYWSAVPSQWYEEPRRLRQLGLLAARKVPGKTRERTFYTLTGDGLDALRRWLEQPARFPRIQNEAAVRLLAGDLVDDAVIVHSLGAMREEIDQLAESLSHSERLAEAISHRAPYLRLSHGLARRLLDAHRDWLDEVERELE